MVAAGGGPLARVSRGARRSRRFEVARSPAFAEYSKLLGLLAPKWPEDRAPMSRQPADALSALPFKRTRVTFLHDSGFIGQPDSDRMTVDERI
jgi:hypothetical protein